MKDSPPFTPIQVNSMVFLKDPQSSQLGLRIVSGAIALIEEIGFESFTFRKLAKSIQSTEASIYRYFESKHKLLLYLLSWYWVWLNYRMIRELDTTYDAVQRLKKVITLLTDSVEEDTNFLHIDEVKLHRIVVAESAKAFLTKEVDSENKEGFFKGYEHIVSFVSEIILEINPHYEYPQMLVSTIIEGAHNQHFFTEHIPHLTTSARSEHFVKDFFQDMVLKTIGK